MFWTYLTPRSCGGCTSGPQEPDVSTCPWPPSMWVLSLSCVRNMQVACCMFDHESRFTSCRDNRSMYLSSMLMLHSLHWHCWLGGLLLFTFFILPYFAIRSRYNDDNHTEAHDNHNNKENDNYKNNNHNNRPTTSPRNNNNSISGLWRNRKGRALWLAIWQAGRVQEYMDWWERGELIKDKSLNSIKYPWVKK